jgi:alpha-mannosidase
MNRYFNLASADIVVPNQDACMSEEGVFGILVDCLLSGHLMWDFNTLREIVDTLPGNSPLQNKALVTANAIMNAFKTGDPENINQMREIAEDVFGKGWQELGAEIYQEGPGKAQVVGISYCHIVRYQVA